MILYVVAWVSFSCPMFLGSLPTAAKAIVCEMTIEQKLLSKPEWVAREIEDLPDDATFSVCSYKDGKKKKLRPIWKAVIK